MSQTKMHHMQVGSITILLKLACYKLNIRVIFHFMSASAAEVGRPVAHTVSHYVE